MIPNVTNQILVKCENCNKEFSVTPSRFKRGSGKHCSRKCSYENRPEKPDKRPDFSCTVCSRIFKATITRKRMGNVLFCSKVCRGIRRTEECTVSKICEGCKKEFKIPNCREKNGEGKFCSDKCRLENWKKIDRNGKLKGRDENCLECGILFYAQGYSKRKFCSNKCRIENKNQKKEFKCQICNKSFLRKPNKVKKGHVKYCSSKCKGKGQVTKINVPCTFCNKLISKSPWFFKTYKNPFCSTKCVKNFYKGENSPFWRGGITPQRKKIRDSKQYKEWRASIFERDNFTCQNCKAKSEKGKSIYLHAHHIKSFHNFPELRFEVTNGVTLCIECHKKTDNFGMKAKQSHII